MSESLNSFSFSNSHKGNVNSNNNFCEDNLTWKSVNIDLFYLNLFKK